jgi:hypothetical protein
VAANNTEYVLTPISDDTPALGCSWVLTYLPVKSARYIPTHSLGRRAFKYANAVNATFHLKCNKLKKKKTGVLFF